MDVHFRARLRLGLLAAGILLLLLRPTEALSALPRAPGRRPATTARAVIAMKREAATKAAPPPPKQKRPRLPRSRAAHERLAMKQFHRSQVEADIAFDAAVEASLRPAAAAVVEAARGEEGALPPMHSGSYPALVLNADYRPLSYLPLSLMSWQDSVKAVCRDTVQVVATYDRSVRSPSTEIPLPSVIVLKKYSQQHAGKAPALTRRNLFMRDNFECQYCGIMKYAKELTYDHVHPRKLGGKTTWANTVTACAACNNKKGSRLLKDIPDMALRKAPRVPQWGELQAGSRRYPPKRMHSSWKDFF